jgi:putative NADH-flavin reductase
MHLFLLGATGRVGSQVLTQALADGHRVTALVRNPEKVTKQADGLNLVQGDASSEHDLRTAMVNTQAIMSCLSTDGGTLLSDSTPLILESMKELGIRRIVTVGTAGILQSREYPTMLRYESPETRRSRSLSRAAEEHHNAWRWLAGSNLDWTIVCPTYLPEGERKGIYRVERDYLPDGGTSISVADTADFAYKQIGLDEYIGCRVGISY